MEEHASGRCLCGGVSYEVEGPLRHVVDCHCHRCRRWTGHYLAASGAETERVAVADVEGLLTWFAVPGASYGFCRRCGSSLFWKADVSPDHLSIAAGTLEPPTGLRTTDALWVSEASDYFDRPAVKEWERE